MRSLPSKSFHGFSEGTCIKNWYVSFFLFLHTRGDGWACRRKLPPGSEPICGARGLGSDIKRGSTGINRQDVRFSFSHSVGEGVGEYVEAMGRRGRKPLTLDGMRRGCRRCCERLEEMFPGILLGEVGDEEVIALQQSLMSDFKESTARTYLEDFGGYLEWATGVNEVKRARLMWNGRADVERVWITAEDYRRLYREASPRERMMLALGATMGMRREETMTLGMSQIRDGMVEIHGKGHGPKGKVDPKPMSEGVREALSEWLPERERILRRTGRETDRLIVSWCGKPMDEGTMS